MSTYHMRADAIKGVIQRLTFDKEQNRYTVKMDTLLAFIAELDSNNILGWSDRQRFVFERNPEGYMHRLFGDAGLGGKPVVIV